MNAYGYTSSTASGPPVSLRLGHAAGLTAHRAVIQHRGRRFTTLKGKALRLFVGTGVPDGPLIQSCAAHINFTPLKGKIMQRKTVFFKYTAYALLALGLFVLQFSRGVSVSLFGFRCDYFIMYTVAVAMFEGMTAGTFAGFIAAFCVCMAKGGFPLGYMLFYPFLGMITGFIVDIDFRKHLLTALLFTIAGSVVYDIAAHLLNGVFIGIPWGEFVKDLFLSLPVTIIFSILVYYAVLFVRKLYGEDNL